MQSPPLPQCCSPAAFRLLTRHAPAIESTDGLLHGALAIGLHLSPTPAVDADPAVQRIADAVRGRCRSPRPQATLAHLHSLLFDELGFAGQTVDYHHPVNSDLPAVLHRRRGLPITLALVYVLVARRLGLRAWGVGFPGHFLAGVDCDGGALLIDPFHGGQVVDRDDALVRLRSSQGAEAQWSDDLIAPVSHRQWLTRMMQNLLHSYATAGRFTDVAAMLELEMALWPTNAHLQRDLALVLARAGLPQQAGAWLDTYLRNHPDDPQHGDLSQLLGALRA